ncbi:MAG: hypothetical protein IMZ53_16540, partial [Thermoplasmata archaeon]|nr:hypothetical protein [Thermoplasmata archaeon]
MDILGTFNFVNIKGLIGAVVFITAAFLIYKWWDKRKKKKAEAEEKALTQAETPQIETVMPLADSAPSGYTCKCGAGPFILKEMRKHLMDLARKEKGKHGWAGKPSKAVAIAASALPTSIAQKKDVAMVSAFGKYAAYVWEPNPGII